MCLQIRARKAGVGISRGCGPAARGGLRGARWGCIALLTLLSRRTDAKAGRLNGRAGSTPSTPASTPSIRPSSVTKIFRCLA